METQNCNKPNHEGSIDNKLKFLCSFGGKILPRPGDWHLQYVGGETKLVVVSRNIGFAEMKTKLADFCGNNVILKYQLPTQDLDVLISITCDEDLQYMMDEYEKFDGLNLPRLRIFAFPLPATTPDKEKLRSSRPIMQASQFRNREGVPDIPDCNSPITSPPYLAMGSPPSPFFAVGSPNGHNSQLWRCSSPKISGFVQYYAAQAVPGISNQKFQQPSTPGGGYKYCKICNAII